TRKGLLIAAACQIGAMEAVSRLPDKYKFYSSNEDRTLRGILHGKAIENLANAPLALLIGNIAALCLKKRPDLSFVAATQIASVHLIAAALFSLHSAFSSSIEETYEHYKTNPLGWWALNGQQQADLAKQFCDLGLEPDLLWKLQDDFPIQQFMPLPNLYDLSIFQKEWYLKISDVIPNLIPEGEKDELTRAIYYGGVLPARFSEEWIDEILENNDLSTYLYGEIVKRPYTTLLREDAYVQSRISAKLFIPLFQNWNQKSFEELKCDSLLLLRRLIISTSDELMDFNIVAEPHGLDVWDPNELSKYIELAKGNQDRTNLLISFAQKKKVLFLSAVTDETREVATKLFDPTPVPTIEDLHRECREDQNQCWTTWPNYAMNKAVQLFIDHNMPVISLERESSPFGFEGLFPTADTIETLQDNQVRWYKEILDHSDLLFIQPDQQDAIEQRFAALKPEELKGPPPNGKN
ncbi:MAG: hypothetical protein KDK76_02950, partial [Chlamydiia bacterium]|nr:hypothetical protein [Chlamydiia bacterium]